MIERTELMIDVAWDAMLRNPPRDALYSVVDAVLTLAQQDMLARIEGKRGEGVCSCDDPDGIPINPATGAAMEHHCDCDAVTVAAALAGDRARTRHAAECVCG